MTAGAGAQHADRMTTSISASTSTPSPSASRVRLISAVGGVGIPVLTFAGLHLLHPSGVPEQMDATQITRWASSGSAGLWSGGVLELLSALLLVGWAELVLPGSDLGTRWARTSLQVTATLLAGAGLLQVTVGIISTPAERLVDREVLPVLFFAYGSVAVAAWCLTAPAFLVASRRRDLPRSVRVMLGVVGLVVVLTLALPAVSWAPAYVGLVLLGLVGPPPGDVMPSGRPGNPSV